ncbi:hypothetical protein C8R45DRAFT_937606 [Mycena sanguinolenta]|nr:hypothetical protein C8R45DRAFT_937606 [Mycena sanguinolenta]
MTQRENTGCHGNGTQKSLRGYTDEESGVLLWCEPATSSLSRGSMGHGTENTLDIAPDHAHNCDATPPKYFIAFVQIISSGRAVWIADDPGTGQARTFTHPARTSARTSARAHRPHKARSTSGAAPWRMQHAGADTTLAGECARLQGISCALSCPCPGHEMKQNNWTQPTNEDEAGMRREETGGEFGRIPSTSVRSGPALNPFRRESQAASLYEDATRTRRISGSRAPFECTTTVPRTRNLGDAPVTTPPMPIYAEYPTAPTASVVILPSLEAPPVEDVEDGVAAHTHRIRLSAGHGRRRSTPRRRGRKRKRQDDSDTARARAQRGEAGGRRAGGVELVAGNWERLGEVVKREWKTLEHATTLDVKDVLRRHAGESDVAQRKKDGMEEDCAEHTRLESRLDLRTPGRRASGQRQCEEARASP